MTKFENFLKSNDTKPYITDDGMNVFTKAKCSEKTELIYDGFADGFSTKLECFGIYNREKKELYGKEYLVLYRNELKTDMLKGNVVDLIKAYSDDLYKKYEEYCDENYDEMLKYNSFNLDIGEYKTVIRDYIANEPLTKIKNEFPDPSFRNVIAYFENAEETINNDLNEWLNVKHKTMFDGKIGDYIYRTGRQIAGRNVYVNDCLQQYYKELSKNPDNPYKTRHDIYAALKNNDAKNVTLNFNDYTSFKVNRENLMSSIVRDSKLSMWKLYKDYEYTDLNSISYRGKNIYESKNIRDKTLEQEQEEEEDMER